MKKIFVPPIKSQGIKTKLVNWINEQIAQEGIDRWVEPFMGTGVVAFNIQPKCALLCDSNPHLISFYQAMQDKQISSSSVKRFLISEGEKLRCSDGEHYYKVRERFNKYHDPFDFLFLSRSCFNGMMRFNKSGSFNVPFCKKPNRFAPALITKIANQVNIISKIIDLGHYTFKNQDFSETLNCINPQDIVYADPPYLGRHVDYFDSWDEDNEYNLYNGLKTSGAKFILSTWLSNKYRINEYIFSIWSDCYITTKEHFYHVGPKETNRNAVYEALLSNFILRDSVDILEMKKRISNSQSQITETNKTIIKPEQMSLNFDAISGSISGSSTV